MAEEEGRWLAAVAGRAVSAIRHSTVTTCTFFHLTPGLGVYTFSHPEDLRELGPYPPGVWPTGHTPGLLL